MPEEHTERTPLIATVRVAPQRQRYPHTNLRRFCSIALGGLLVIVVILFLLPYAILPGRRGSMGDYMPGARPYPHSAWPETDGLSFEDLQKILLSTPQEENAREWSRYYTSGQHVAGRNLTQALWTRDKMEENGISAEVVAYDVYLNYPIDRRLALLKRKERASSTEAADYKIEYECSLEEDVLEEDPTTGLNERVPTFHAYSATGNVTASYVFVNFGTFQDFEDLVKANVSLKGRIALAKYGRGFRGLKVERAQELGMIGVVMYSDPQEDGKITELNGYKTYPDGPARNPSSVQRGSVSYLSVLAGDPTTPGYASKPGVPRADPHVATPKIPSIPISYREALPLLKALNGYGPKASQFNEAWQHGGLAYKGVEYNIGPSPDDIVLNLVNEQEYMTTPIWDVIGVINGTIPDEAVVIGNHRDAWVAGGAGDPNSGTTALMETVRSFGEALKQGYKPLRTIVFCSWDGEEYNLLGSTEWVEDHLPWLTKGSVAYINIDDNSGTKFEAKASPLLLQTLNQVTSLVPSPNQSTHGQSVFDVWGGETKIIGSGSDYTAFLDFAGVSSMDFGFKRTAGDSVYHYHSNYDSFYWMDKYGDPGWHYHVAAAQLLALFGATIAETPVLNFKATHYAIGLKAYLQHAKDTAASYSASSSFSFSILDHALELLGHSAKEFDARAADLALELTEPIPWWKWWRKVQLFYEIRKVNTKYKTLEQQFLYPEGLDGRPFYKHVVFSPGRWEGYGGATFPGLIESFENGNLTNAKRWRTIILDRLEAFTALLE